MMVSFSFSLAYDLTDTVTWSHENSQTTTRMKQESKKKVTAVESGFSYQVAPGQKVKIQSTSKRLDGVLPWSGNARCLDKNGHVVEENNIFGNYKSYGLSTSQVVVLDMECGSSGGDD